MIWNPWEIARLDYMDDPGLGGLGITQTLPMWDGMHLVVKPFNIGFEGANPGPSVEESKPRYRVKVGSRKL